MQLNQDLKRGTSELEEKASSKKGQTAIEVILMISFVAGLMTMVTPMLDQQITGVISKIMDSVQTVGWTGGYAPPDENQPLNPHYDGSDATMEVQ